MSCNPIYKNLSGWYFMSSCTCGETAEEAVKKILSKKIHNIYDNTFKIGLYPFVFYRTLIYTLLNFRFYASEPVTILNQCIYNIEQHGQ